MFAERWIVYSWQLTVLIFREIVVSFYLSRKFNIKIKIQKFLSTLSCFKCQLLIEIFFWLIALLRNCNNKHKCSKSKFRNEKWKMFSQNRKFKKKKFLLFIRPLLAYILLLDFSWPDWEENVYQAFCPNQYFTQLLLVKYIFLEFNVAYTVKPLLTKQTFEVLVKLRCTAKILTFLLSN